MIEDDTSRTFSMTVKEVAVVNFAAVTQSKDMTGAREALQGMRAGLSLKSTEMISKIY